MDSHYRLVLPPRWVNAADLETAIAQSGAPLSSFNRYFTVVFPVGCKIMVDAAIRLLSLVNQVAYFNRPVILHFEQGMSGTMGYLDRIGFFNQLDSNITTFPIRPIRSAAHTFAGRNSGVVELQRIDRLNQNNDVPPILADRLTYLFRERSDSEKIGYAAFTVFAELIGNIYRHSETLIDGYAALQVYSKLSKASVVVSDSGVGLLRTLRPSLSDDMNKKSDPELITQMINEGISRFGKNGGTGLSQSAVHALKYKAILNIRLPTSNFELIPSKDGYNGEIRCTSQMPWYRGTHISFEFRLDDAN